MEGTVAVQLPQEVLDTILDNLHPRDDVQTLKQCALTARCLVPAAQRILFREVILTEYKYSGTKRPDRFLSLLNKSPHLAKYITELELHFHERSLQPDDLSQHPSASILPRLQSLKKVSVHWHDTSASGSRDFTLKISTLLGGAAMPKIKSLTLRSISVTMHEIFAIGNWLAAHGGLQVLHFMNVLVLDSNAIPPSMASQDVSSFMPIRLLRFTIIGNSRNTEALLRWATGSTSPLRFNALRELTVGDLVQESSVYLLHILDMAKNTLSCLHVTGRILSLSSFQFNTYRNLRHIIHGQLFPPFKAMLKEWCITLKESRELKLESFVIPDRYHSALDHDYPWSELEDALISGGRCAHLVLRIFSDKRMDTDTIRECFPLLHASDVCDLVVQNTVGSLSTRTVSWEYTSRSGEWKSVPEENFVRWLSDKPFLSM
ncbi:hypothetical protein VNI00_018219 [Paramarasmius palmivorus]|uniref:F-box domain-containing protein n=1 Tax=Paramarasmius palmivorus TaxID=297713 RepID=A0AAW0B2L6_9AGAR